MRSHKSEPLQPIPPTTRRRRRWPLWLAAFGLLTALAVWLAPTIVAKTALRQQLVPWAVPELDCGVRIGSASLGWFSPIALNDVVVSDAAGEPLAVVGAVRSEKTIWALISDTSQLGRFDIRGPQVNIVLRDDGSNLQDALAPLLTPSDTPPAALGVQLRITEGRINVADQVSGHTLQLADLGFELHKPLATDQALTSTLQAKLNSGDETGTLRADVTWIPPTDAAADSLGRGELKLSLDSVTLAAVQPLLDRFAPGTRLAGRLSTELAMGFQGTTAQPSAELSGWVRAGSFVLDAPAWLGSDRLWSETVRLNGRVALIDGRLELAGTGIQTDVAHLKLSGSAPVAQLAEKPWVPWLAETLQAENYQLEGDIDLARLAAMLPGTLRVREGTEITSGRVSFQSQGLVSEEGRRMWLGSIHTEQLAATANGSPVSWEAPLEFSLAAHQSDQGPVVDKLICKADFLEVNASGDWREAHFDLQGDLDQLASELNQFFDLGSLDLAGKLGASLTFLHPQEDRLEVKLVSGVAGLRLSLPGGKTLSEPDLKVEASAVGLGDGTGLRSVQRMEFTLVAGDDVAKIRLLNPVEAPGWKSSWPLAVDVAGDLDHWLHRFQPWLPTQGWDISGLSHVIGKVYVSPDKIAVQEAVVELTRLHAHGPGLYVDEPHVRIETTCSWDQNTGHLAAPSLTLTASDAGGPAGETVAVELRAEQVAVQPTESGPPKVSGNVTLRGPLERFTQWITDPRSQPTQYVGGLINGSANLECVGSQTNGTWSLTVDNLVYATLQTAPPARTARQPGTVAPAAATARWEPVWRESRATIEGQAQYDFSADALRLDRLDVASQMLRLTAAGSIDELSGRRLTKMTGEVDYDLNQVTAKFGQLLGPQVVLTGRQQRSFSIQGPLDFSQSVASTEDDSPTRLASRVSPADGFSWPQDLTGSAGFGWTAADLFGLRAGEGNFDAQLADGVITAPMDVSLNGGRIRLAPRMVLGGSPAMLLIDQGRAVENVQITDQMSSTWLKFVAPLFADATRIDGRFSMDVGHAQVPLATPKTSNVAGTLHIHSARLRPGPMFDQFVLLAQQIQALIELRPLSQAGSVPRSGLVEVDPQSVPFQMVDGRVYHRDLTLNVRGVRIRTSGSVGLDQSVKMIAEVPILEEWGQRGGALASLGGQSLKIPIRGHLGQPKIDDKVLRQVARNVAESAAGQLIERGLDRALEGIFRPGGRGP